MHYEYRAMFFFYPYHVFGERMGKIMRDLNCKTDQMNRITTVQILLLSLCILCFFCVLSVIFCSTIKAISDQKLLPCTTLTCRITYQIDLCSIWLRRLPLPTIVAVICAVAAQFFYNLNEESF